MLECTTRAGKLGDQTSQTGRTTESTLERSHIPKVGVARPCGGERAAKAVRIRSETGHSVYSRAVRKQKRWMYDPCMSL